MGVIFLQNLFFLSTDKKFNNTAASNIIFEIKAENFDKKVSTGLM